LALAPRGDYTATVESEDPGNLPIEPHAKVVVRGPDGKVFLNFDPCQTCRYANPAFSSQGELTFLATDEKKGQTTLFHVPNGVPRPLTVIAGFANTIRFSPNGSQIALLVTLGAKKKTGATEAAVPWAAELIESFDVAEIERRVGGFTVDDFALIVTRDHAIDLRLLEQLFVRDELGYLGMIGSRGKVGRFRKRLEVRGLLEGELGAARWARLRAPVGLNLGAETPEEIAVAIAAELVAVRRLGVPAVEAWTPVRPEVGGGSGTGGGIGGAGGAAAR